MIADAVVVIVVIQPLPSPLIQPILGVIRRTDMAESSAT